MSERLAQIPPSIDRRKFLAGTSALAAMAAVSCSISPQESQEISPQTELEDNPQMGDIILAGREAILLRNNKGYRIPNLEIYKRNTKFEQYGRRIFSVPASALSDYEVQSVSTERVDDPFTGNKKDGKPFGGEMTVFFSGFMTDGGLAYDHIKHDEHTFLLLRGALDRNGFENEDSLFFTWGERGKMSYPSKNTARPLQESIKHALEFFVTLKELFPLAQFNVVGHSLGALMALEVARWHNDAINNLVFIDGPLKGLEKTFIRGKEVEFGREKLKEYFDIEERVIDDLFQRFDDKNYHRELDQFGVSLATSKKRGLINFYNENDGIVPPESARIKGAEEHPIPKENKIVTYLEYLEEHGRNLRRKETLERITKAFGQNLAKAG